MHTQEHIANKYTDLLHKLSQWKISMSEAHASSTYRNKIKPLVFKLACPVSFWAIPFLMPQMRFNASNTLVPYKNQTSKCKIKLWKKHNSFFTFNKLQHMQHKPESMIRYLIGPCRFSYNKISIFKPSQLYFTSETCTILLKECAIILKKTEGKKQCISRIEAHEEKKLPLKIKQDACIPLVYTWNDKDHIILKWEAFNQNFCFFKESSH